MNKYFTAAAFLLFSTASSGQENITPSHVYQVAQQIIAAIESIRVANNIDTAAREPGIQTNKRPIHVYAKSLEIFEKIGRYQSMIGIDRIGVNQIPLRKITPSEVYIQANSILTELAKIQMAQGIVKSSKYIQFVAKKGPSDVYEAMWKASYLLDALAGQTSANEVFRNTQYILAEIALIKENLNVEIPREIILQRSGSKTPKDVNLEAFKTLHAVGRLQRHLDIPPYTPSPFPTGGILPNDTLDTTNTILAELARIKVALEIPAPRITLPMPSGKTPNTVFEKMLLISSKITPLMAATSKRNPAQWNDVASR